MLKSHEACMYIARETEKVWPGREVMHSLKKKKYYSLVKRTRHYSENIFLGLCYSLVRIHILMLKFSD